MLNCKRVFLLSLLSAFLLNPTVLSAMDNKEPENLSPRTSPVKIRDGHKFNTINDAVEDRHQHLIQNGLSGSGPTLMGKQLIPMHKFFNLGKPDQKEVRISVTEIDVAHLETEGWSLNRHTKTDYPISDK